MSGARRTVAAAFGTLFAMSAAHALLETARDALFLARLSPAQLPWMYLGIAAAAGATLRVRGSWDRAPGVRTLPVLLLATSAVTFAIWASGALGRPWMLRGLYVWTGVSATITGLELWLSVNALWPVTQAKRTFRWIALGGLAGAIAGAAFARGIAASGAPDRLVLASAIVQALAASPALLLSRSGRPAARARPSLRDATRLLREHPYVRGVTALAFLATVTFTGVDLVFKSHVAREIPVSQLPAFFATFYAALNALALVAQIALTGWLLRVVGLPRAHQVLPAVLLVASAGVAAGLGVGAALLLKGAQGALRDAHRTTSELLLVPMPDDVRAQAKPFLDVVVGRGGQALASLALAGPMALPGGDSWVAAGIALLCGAALAQAVALRKPYLELFRGALRDRAPAEFPPLNLEAIEVLVAALGSADDAEVLAAMDVLADQGRARLVPTVILHHPCEDVALRALAIFQRHGRCDLAALANRLRAHPSPRIRAAALQASATAADAGARLQEGLADPSASVRAAAAVALVSLCDPAHDGTHALDDLLRDPDPDATRAVARAIANRPSPALEGVLRTLASSDDGEILVEVARAIGALRRAPLLPVLLGLLARREARAAAREAFTAFGDDGLRFLEAALADAGRVRHEVRRHVPRTISRFPPERAARILLARLPDEPDGAVRFKILRGLGRIVADSPSVVLDRDALQRAIHGTLEASFRLLHWRGVLAAGAREDPRRATAVHELLAALLRDKERHAVERLFRLLALQLRDADLEDVHRGLRNADPRLRASSRELLEHLLPLRLRRPVLALVDDAPGVERLAAAGDLAPRERLDYEPLLAALLAQPRDTLRALTMQHVAELGLADLRAEIARVRRDQPSPLVERAAARALRALPERAREVSP